MLLYQKFVGIHMIKNTLRLCPICASQRAENLHIQQFVIPANVPLPEEYDIVSCEECHFVYADTPNNAQQYENYYANHAKYDFMKTSPEDEHRHAETAKFLMSHIKNNSTIIDIGCSNGDLLKKFKEHGCNQLTGIDPSENCVKHLNQLGIQSHALTLSEIHTHPFEPYDCVILSHVMEHLVEPNHMMSAIKKLTHKNSLVYIEVPDASRYLSHFFKSFHYFDVEHINHFDQDSLKNLANQNGFQLIQTGIKTIPVSNTVSIPAVYALLKPGEQNTSPIKCTHLKNAMREYIHFSKQKLDKSIINDLADSQAPVILWGVGSYAQSLLKSSALKHCNIIDVVDRDPKKQGLTLMDKTIKNPAELIQYKNSNAAILIASIPFADEIQKDIIAMGLNNKILIA